MGGNRHQADSPRKVGPQSTEQVQPQDLHCRIPCTAQPRCLSPEQQGSQGSSRVRKNSILPRNSLKSLLHDFPVISRIKTSMRIHLIWVCMTPARSPRKETPALFMLVQRERQMKGSIKRAANLYGEGPDSDLGYFNVIPQVSADLLRICTNASYRRIWPVAARLIRQLKMSHRELASH